MPTPVYRNHPTPAQHSTGSTCVRQPERPDPPRASTIEIASAGSHSHASQDLPCTACSARIPASSVPRVLGCTSGARISGEILLVRIVGERIKLILCGRDYHSHRASIHQSTEALHDKDSHAFSQFACGITLAGMFVAVSGTRNFNTSMTLLLVLLGSRCAACAAISLGRG